MLHIISCWNFYYPYITNLLEFLSHFYVTVADQISSVFWFYHADLCEERVTAVLDYMSTMAASIEPLIQFANRQRSNSENLSLLDQNFTRGKLHLRCKRRNGRVRVMVIPPSLPLPPSLSPCVQTFLYWLRMLVNYFFFLMKLVN